MSSLLTITNNLQKVENYAKNHKTAIIAAAIAILVLIAVCYLQMQPKTKDTNAQ